MTDMKSVCLIIGAGAGIGGHVGKRFAREGYHVVLCRRSDSDGLETLVKEIEGDGGEISKRKNRDRVEKRVVSIRNGATHTIFLVDVQGL